MRAVTGYVDAEGRLIAADARLLAMQIAAGGGEGGKLAIPQLASLARIARSLAVPVARPVIVSDTGNVLEVLARARLQDGIVHLTLADLDAATLLTPSAEADEAVRAEDFARLEGGISWAMDGDFILTSVGAGAAAIVGAKLDDAVGKPLAAVFVPVPAPNGAMPLLSALAKRTAFEDQFAQVNAPGKPYVTLSGAPVLDEQGSLTGWQGLACAAEAPGEAKAQALAEMSQVAQKLDSALRGPIGRIIENSDAIHAAQEGELKAEYRDYASDISAAGRHLLGLVDDVVDLQAIERPDFHVDHDDIDLADIARRAAGLLSVRAADQKVRIDKPDEQEILPAIGEFRRVLQILVNLIGNAVRYSPEGGMVWVRTEEEDGLAVVIVADQGKGIAPADQDRIFGKFERVDQSEPGGNGLGLYIARKLARAMGGDISVDSDLGMGARFMLTLPSARK